MRRNNRFVTGIGTLDAGFWILDFGTFFSSRVFRDEVLLSRSLLALFRLTPVDDLHLVISIYSSSARITEREACLATGCSIVEYSSARDRRHTSYQYIPVVRYTREMTHRHDESLERG